MGKSQPQPPPAPDPTTVANAQTQSNQQTAQYQSVLNNGNSYGPYGSVVNQQAGPGGQWTQTTTLSPQEQAIFNQGTAAQAGALGIANDQLGRVSDALGQTVTPPSLQTTLHPGQMQTGYGSGGQIVNSFNPGQGVQGSMGPQNFGDAVNNTVNSQYNSMMGLLQPQQDQAAEHQNAQLIAQGLNPNDAAWQNSQTLFNNGQDEQRALVAANAISAGNAEQNTLFGQQLNQGQFANQAAAQQYAQNQGQAAFGNAAQAQGNSQNAQLAAFFNTAQGQQFAQQLQAMQAGNSAQQQNFQNQSYAQQLPINEFTALMGSNQVQAPQAAQLSQTSVAPTDVLGAYALNSQVANQNYQSQMANYQSGLGGLFNLGGSLLGAAGMFL